MGIYDPTFTRKPFTTAWRAGEIPGSAILGQKTNNGCVWPGQSGKWFAARPTHEPSTPFPCFDSKDDAMEYIVEPIRAKHEVKEDAREQAWEDAAPKRVDRIAKTTAREFKRFELRRKHDKVFEVLDGDGKRVGFIARRNEVEASIGAASLVGVKKLPAGYTVKLTEASAAAKD
jgi:hypothetical protein